jgi:C-terminal processing protease CtpA/Prc
MNSTLRYLYLLILCSNVLIYSCQKDNPEDELSNKGVSATTLKLNGFIKEVMTDLYLWTDKMPTINIKSEPDSKAYFYKLLYSEDKWSYITDDASSFVNSLQGIEKTYGYSLAYCKSNLPSGVSTINYFAIVEFVYPNTPAARAGLKRGDLIIKLNNANITSDNYSQLLWGNSITITKGKYTSSAIVESDTFSMSAEELTLDPVLMYKIIEKEGHKIGYLIYLQYISSYNETTLKNALQYFKDNLATDLVLDLRYNFGGYVAAAQYLCSSIAPLNVVNSNSTLGTYQWNNKYQTYWIAKQRDDQLGVKFKSSVAVKLGFSNICILTGPGTASASEFTIAGLKAYMNVTLIGDTTYGKYTGSFTIQPKDWYDNTTSYSGFENWGLQPIVMRYANADGITDFKNGFAPNYWVNDELLPAYPLGDLSEPLLRKAVEFITGNSILAIKKSEFPIKYEIVNRGFSRFDEQKRNLFFDEAPVHQKFKE